MSWILPGTVKLPLLLCLSAAYVFLQPEAFSQTVVSDSLYRNYTQVWGTSPDGINLPGASYAQATGWNFNQFSFPVFDSASGTGAGNGTGIALSLASSGTYVKPTVFSVSVEINIAAPSPLTNTPFAVVGFYSALEASSIPPTFLDSRSNFTGVMLSSDGSLSLYDNGTLVPGSGVAYAGGTFSTGTFYTLTYTVDTTAGAISGLSLEGSAADYSSLLSSASPFSDANTAYLGLGAAVDSDPFKGSARFINLSVVAVPEPASGVLALSGVAFCFVARRRVR